MVMPDPKLAGSLLGLPKTPPTATRAPTINNWPPCPCHSLIILRLSLTRLTTLTRPLIRLTLPPARLPTRSRAMTDAPFIRTKPPPLLVPSSSPNQLNLAAQAQFDSKASSDPTYVLHVVPLPNNHGYLFAGSDDSLRTFSPALEPTGVLPSTQVGITSVVSGAGEGSTAVFVTARDGTVAGWDTRDLSKEAFKLKGKWQARRGNGQEPAGRVKPGGRASIERS